MNAVIIETTNDADVKFWLNLAKKTGARARALKAESVEDKLLGELIEKGMKTRNVSRKSIMDLLEK